MGNILTAIAYIRENLVAWKEAAAWVASQHPRDPKTGKFVKAGTVGAVYIDAKQNRRSAETGRILRAERKSLRAQRAEARQKEREASKQWAKHGDSYEFKYDPSFKNKADAQKWIEDNLAHNVSGVKGTSLSKVNAVLSHLRLVIDKAPLSKKLHEFSFTGAHGGGHLGTFWHNGVIKLNGAQTDDDMGGPKVRKEREIAALAKWNVAGAHTNQSGREQLVSDRIKELESEVQDIIQNQTRGKLGSNAHSLYDNAMAGTLMHEYGHAWHMDNIDKVHKGLGLSWRGRLYSQEVADYKTSQYSATSTTECFAEAFAVYMVGETKLLNPKMVEFFDKEFPKLNFGGTAKKRKRTANA